MKEKSLLSNCGFLLKTAFSLNPRLFAVRIPLLFVNGATPFIPIFMIRLILNEIVEGGTTESILTAVLGLALLTLAGELLAALLEWRNDIQMEITLLKMRQHLGEAVMNMPYALTEQPKVRDFVLLAKESGDLSVILNSIGAIATGIFTMAGLTAVIAGLEPLIFVLVLAVVAVRLWADRRSRRLWNKWRPRYAPIMRKIGYMFQIMKGIEYGKEVRLNRLGDWIYNKTDRLGREYLGLTIKHNQDLQRNNAFSELAVLIQEGAVYLLLAAKVIFTGMSIGDFSMYMTSVNTFSGRLRGIAGAVSELLRCGLFAKDYRYCIENGNGEKSFRSMVKKSDLVNEPDKGIDRGGEEEIRGPLTLEFKDVSFHYPQKEQMALEHVSLTLRQGESLSVVGANGAGKTTFIKLLCRLYEPTEGEILLNGINISRIPYEEYMRRLGVVFQDFKLFAFSMEENITMGMPAEGVNVEECVEKSGLSEKLKSLSKGLSVNLTKEFDSEGVEFSGGEGQKLALARVLYKNAPVLILDEPAAALDPLAEYELYSRFHHLVKGKCAVYVSHRLSSAKFTDKIAVFRQGRIVEYGNHEELMKHEDGVYRSMFRTQAAYYV